MMALFVHLNAYKIASQWKWISSIRENIVNLNDFACYCVLTAAGIARLLCHWQSQCRRINQVHSNPTDRVEWKTLFVFRMSTAAGAGLTQCHLSRNWNRTSTRNKRRQQKARKCTENVSLAIVVRKISPTSMRQKNVLRNDSWLSKYNTCNAKHWIFFHRFSVGHHDFIKIFGRISYARSTQPLCTQSIIHLFVYLLFFFLLIRSYGQKLWRLKHSPNFFE